MALSYPPPVGPDWPDTERLRYIAWVVTVTLGRIDADEPTMPLLAKRPTRAILEAISMVTSWSAATLERERPGLMKPYDPDGDHHGVLVPPEWLPMLAELDGEG
jgi:hypothetical protein